MPSEEVLGGVGNVINIVVFLFSPFVFLCWSPNPPVPTGQGGDARR